MLKEEIEALGFDHTADIPMEKLRFDRTLRALCKDNTCGRYGKSYTCPPYVGEPEELIARLQRYTHGVVFQKIYELEDSYDIEGMMEGGLDFRRMTEKVSDFADGRVQPYLLLSAGGCNKCKVCGVETGEPCRFPDKAFASLESYCLNVSSLAKLCGMKYINGANTVTYFGALFYDPVSSAD